MKICFLAHGSSVHTQRWIRYFQERRHDVSLITFTPPMIRGPIQVCDLKPLRKLSYKKANWHYLLRLPRLKRFIKRIEPDLLLANFLTSYGLMAALVRPHRCPLATWIQGSDLLVFPKRSALHRAITCFAINKADLIILPGAHMLEDLFSLADSGASVLTLQYGIDPGRFYPLAPLTHLDRPVCFSNRAMVPGCGVETILRAAAVLAFRGSALRFILCDSTDRNASFRDMAKALQLMDTIRFEGRIEHEQMPAALRRAAIYISMVSPDGPSISLMEAMACGLFPVVSDIPANRDWVTEGVNGFLVPPGRADILADRLQKAWDNRELRRRAAGLNWEQVLDRCDFSRNMQKIETAIVKLVTPQTASPCFKAQ